MRKWYILCILLLLLMLPFAPASAETEGDFTYAVIDGHASITAYTGSAAELILPDTLGGYPVTAIGYCAFRSCTTLTQVVICEGVASIGSNAFQNCFSLRQVSLPGSLVSLGSHAFYGCPALKQVSLPDSLVRLYPYAFYGCSAVRLCSLNGQAARTLTRYGYSFTSPQYPQLALKAFEDEDGIRTFTVTDCDDSAVSVALPDGVTAIESHAFSNCTALTEIVLPGIVTEIADNAFSGCANVTVIAPDGSAAQALCEAHAENGFIWRPL